MTQSWVAMTLLASGMILTVFLLVLFSTGKRYLRGPKPDRGVGFVQDRLTAEERLASLAPRLLEAEAREKALTGSLQSGAPPDPASRRSMVEALREADVSGLWRSFGTASALAEDDPRMAREELDALLHRTQSALERLAEAEDARHRPIEGDQGEVVGEDSANKHG